MIKKCVRKTKKINGDKTQKPKLWRNLTKNKCDATKVDGVGPIDNRPSME